MTMNRQIAIGALLALTLTLTGCALNQPLMDQPAADNYYHYENSDLGFSLLLPPEFIYYQTQRRRAGEATELAIFVPTSDERYPQEVPGYAKPLSVEIYELKAWEKMTAEQKAELNEIGRKGGRVYTLNFWQTVPSDWTGKWTEEMRQKISADLKLK